LRRRERTNLEEARKADGERLDKIETMVGEIHDILVKARGFKWVLDGLFKYAGQISIACGAGYGAWRFFTGH
jgi:hypothetical protein